MTGAQVHAHHPIDELMALIREEVAEHAEDGDAHVADLDEQTRAAADAANAEDAEALASATEETATTIETAQAALPEGDTDAFVGSVDRGPADDRRARIRGGGRRRRAGAPRRVPGRLRVRDGGALALRHDRTRPSRRRPPRRPRRSRPRSARSPRPCRVRSRPRPWPTPRTWRRPRRSSRTSSRRPSARSCPRPRTPPRCGRTSTRLLDEIQSTYEGGDPDEAAELAAEAYLENYELVEASVIEAAPGRERRAGAAPGRRPAAHRSRPASPPRSSP